MRSAIFSAIFLPVLAFGQAAESADPHKHHRMTTDNTGTVMNENTDTLPRGCDGISVEHSVTINAGRDYAADSPGMMFGMSEHEVRVEPCSRVTVKFVNDDEVRHQWMVHGLPKYLYPAGMFHLEAMGGQSVSGTFIVPREDKTYLVHCDLAQHMEKGMRGQLVVGKGSGKLWGVWGISDAFYRSSYLPGAATAGFAATFIVGFLTTLLVRRSRMRRH